jgi:hypothetical protein
MVRITMDEYHNNKSNLLCCLINCRKYFDTVPKIKLWYRLEEIKVPFELRDIVIRLYKNVFSKFRNIEG